MVGDRGLIQRREGVRGRGLLGVLRIGSVEIIISTKTVKPP